MAVVTLNIHHRGFRGVQVPGILRFLILRCCAKLLLVQQTTEPSDESKDSVEAFKEIRLQLNVSPSLFHAFVIASSVATATTLRETRTMAVPSFHYNNVKL